MTSTKSTKSRQQHCPVVNKDIVLNFEVVSLPNSNAPPAIGLKSCSNIESCLAKFNNLSTVPQCLLHTLV